MTENIFWLFEAVIKPGEYDNFKTVMEEMIASTEQEPGTSNYEFFLNADRTVCHIYERYADSDAALTHVGNFGANFAERFMVSVEPKKFVVYGPASDPLKEVLDGFGVEYMTPLDGFAK
ncbi:MAG: antibiotic biosynthesis monooxygenase [Candidatus Latescibacteria bacterium]|jgi:quinol monooxygenase YgiN|nr:antibiotic biosynthesis monooxygenase [Candidatus Latescibacterota bacterium]